MVKKFVLLITFILLAVENLNAQNQQKSFLEFYRGFREIIKDQGAELLFCSRLENPLYKTECSLNILRLRNEMTNEKINILAEKCFLYIDKKQYTEALQKADELEKSGASLLAKMCKESVKKALDQNGK
jgi:hypothetical protein